MPSGTGAILVILGAKIQIHVRILRLIFIFGIKIGVRHCEILSSVYIFYFIEFTVQVTDLQIVWKKGGGDDLGSFVITAPIFEFLLEVPRVPKKES